jgi:probable phosphoglycerate mutase
LRIIIIRHGDPDYEHDSLTPRGDTEAKLLADIIDRYNIDHFYVSPLGRAQRTASFSLEKLGKTATTLDWLKEFPPRILRPDGNGRRMIAWDWRPADWTKIPEMYDKDKWCTHPIMHEGGVDAEASYVYDGLDTLLAKHGYERDGNLYHAKRPNHDTIVLVCHFGVEVVLLSHLFGVSPMTLWHSTCALPTSVTTLYTEERREGIAYFRMSAFGDTSHLYAAGREPSFAARFCETFSDDTRHD